VDNPVATRLRTKTNKAKHNTTKKISNMATIEDWGGVNPDPQEGD
jgi:hypothetical protein